MKSVYSTCLLGFIFLVSAEAGALAPSDTSGCESNTTIAGAPTNPECVEVMRLAVKTDRGARGASGEASENERWTEFDTAQGFVEHTGTSGTEIQLAAQHERETLGESESAVPNAVKGQEADSGACPDCPELIPIPGNKFALGKYTVTFAEWDACVAEGGCGGYHPSDNGWGRGNRPVINVNWNDAQAYIEWLSNKTGKAYRLPTAKEWEIAALAGSTTKYYWGDDAGRNNANCDGCGSEWDNKRTAPAGSFKPNAFGLYDMMGNVWQWTDSCWKENCARRMFCGGSWNHRPEDMRASACKWFDTSKRMRYLGFRLARTLP